MDRQQTVKVLSVLKAAYPHAFKDLTRIDAEAMINLWEMMFSADPYEEVNAAVAALIATRSVGFSPTVGEVKEQIRKLHTKEEILKIAEWIKGAKHWYFQCYEESDKVMEKRFSAYYSKHIKEWNALTEQERMIISNGIRSRSVNEGMPMESVTMDDWLKHVEKIKP